MVDLKLFVEPADREAAEALVGDPRRRCGAKLSQLALDRVDVIEWYGETHRHATRETALHDRGDPEFVGDPSTVVDDTDRRRRLDGSKLDCACGGDDLHQAALAPLTLNAMPL
ncbi:hypothetical protein [Sphingomonas sp. Leaf30]|uniref:hypothetical protein n=1 Tax=Sphingomonas sp. Leaf30 TaxID=1736213 RepID=UPI001443BD64|nr:hypothetical protein [Sphingomonas sp. Leaf30]